MSGKLMEMLLEMESAIAASAFILIDSASRDLWACQSAFRLFLSSPVGLQLVLFWHKEAEIKFSNKKCSCKHPDWLCYFIFSAKWAFDCVL